MPSPLLFWTPLLIVLLMFHDVYCSNDTDYVAVENMVTGRSYILDKSVLPTTSCRVWMLKHLLWKHSGFQLKTEQQILFHNQRHLGNQEIIDISTGHKLHLLYKFVNIVVWIHGEDVLEIAIPLFNYPVWPTNATAELSEFKKDLLERIKLGILEKVEMAPHQARQQRISLKEKFDGQATIHVELKY